MQEEGRLEKGEDEKNKKEGLQTRLNLKGPFLKGIENWVKVSIF
jgi:hypothetical protein